MKTIKYASTSTQTGSTHTSTHRTASTQSTSAQPASAQPAGTQDASTQTMRSHFRYCDLPQELRLKILTFTDLVVPGNKVWWDPDDKYTLDDPWQDELWPCPTGTCGTEYNCHPWSHVSCEPSVCRRRCRHSPSDEEGQIGCYECKHYMCPFNHCRHEQKKGEKPCRIHSEKGRCTCIWSPPTAIFLVDRTVCHHAQEVFFKHNLFNVRYRIRGPFKRARFGRGLFNDFYKNYLTHERRYGPAADMFLGNNIFRRHVACKSLRRLSLNLLECEFKNKKEIWRERFLTIPALLLNLECLTILVLMPKRLRRTNLEWSTEEGLEKVREVIHEEFWNLDSVGIKTERDKYKAVEKLYVQLVWPLGGPRSVKVVYKLYPKYAFLSPRLNEPIISGQNGWTHDVAYGSGESAGYYTESICVRFLEN